ncbi:protein DMP2-like [Zingiber officinale]|uniref:Uncharacterized protein n=1 Tax=Zingiber officinale TaxID=94328 RepID=A0A8J5EMH8_ZINOF|nr:protein DMP2-like [Zingiber officinale]KAG6468853.1 hypothetical protein ZIOFF_073546 [Zingiber officinale]
MAKELEAGILRPSSRSGATMGDRAFKGVGDLIKLLPTGTVFLFQFLSPLLTNAGHCFPVNRWLSGALLLVCAFACSFACFTDSFVDPSDGKLYYGVVTARGIWLFSDPGAAARNDLSGYKLRPGDFAHAALSLLVFAAVALLDNNTASCFYPALLVEEKTLVTVLPPVIGAVAGVVFMLFPNNRHGIGYPPNGTAAAEKSAK